ncbi:MAG TPA: ribosome maturation factor RimM [Pseudogracilibacillus sp.]|nr:ribosome maturation factor RimM [Pseudogracilibacillus sp.]
MYVIGKVINTHGVKGEVKVLQSTDFDQRFAVGEKVYIKQGDTYDAFVIAHARPHKNALLIQFEGLNEIDDVLFLKNETLYITEKQQESLPEGEYYYREIIGCQMKTTEGQVLGIVDSILSPGANDVWVVKNDAGDEYYIPYIDDVVKAVDLDAKEITIEVMEGLLDI